MATRRIKEITNTATTFASDDFIALDGTSQGTRKMDKDDLIAEVSAGVSGDYLEEANNLSDVASLDTSKLNMEIPDVGTAPNEVPLSGQLGTMAFQDSAGVSVGQLEADEIGVGVTPSGNPLEVAGTNGNFSIAADGNTANFSRNAANYIAATADTSSALAVLAKHSFQVHTGNPTVERVRINASGDIDVNTGDITQRESATIYNKLDTDSSGLNLTVNAGQANVTRNLIFKTSVTGGAVTERMRLDGQGRLGIGGSPSELLHLTNATAGAGVDANIRFSPTTSTTRYAEIQAVNSDGNNNIDLRFFTAPAGTPVERLRIDSQGRLGVNQTAPSTNANSIADDLVVGNTGQASGITVVGGTGSTSAMVFGAGGTTIKGGMVYDHSSNQLELSANSATRWLINSSGNLAATGAYGIDFGQATPSAGGGTGTTGTPANSVLSDYEFGSWVPRFEMTGANFAAITMDVIAAQYCKVGRHVHCQAMIRTDNVDTSGASGTVAVNGLPFVSDTTASNYGGFSVGWSTAWVNAPNAGFVQPNSAYVHLTRNGTTGMSTITASDVTNGASANKNELIFTVSYIAST